MAYRRNILVVDSDPLVEEMVPQLAKAKDPSVLAKVVSTMSDALQELGNAGYDAVLLRVDGPRDMSLLLRIKESSPDIPVIALVPKDREELSALVRESGADEVQPTAGGGTTLGLRSWVGSSGRPAT